MEVEGEDEGASQWYEALVIDASYIDEKSSNPAAVVAGSLLLTSICIIISCCSSPLARIGS